MALHVIKLDATDSTNAYLRRLLPSNMLDDYTIVTAREQTKGRGQMGTTWQSEVGKNLTFSVLRANLKWPIHQGFVLNLCVSLAVHSVLKQLRIPDLSIKWPNDILSGSSKLCGILIENKIAGSTINSSIIGIGLNVNQTDFGPELQHVSSLRLVMDRIFDLDGMLQDVVEKLQSVFSSLETDGPDALWKTYEKHLFRKGMLSTFEDSDGEFFEGRIKGVTREGKLSIASEDAGTRDFALKEVKLLY
ncbi:MAG: biotin--[acetyl-CoA-carboxylase] ligase [Pricia sp.]